MPPTLRPYQVEDVARIRRAYADGAKAPLYVAPTGSGKTVLFAFIAAEAAARGNRVVIVVHRRELLLQGSRALTALGLQHGIIAPGFPRVTMQTQIASVQTLVRRVSKMPVPDLLVIDEGHHATAGSWAKVREAWSRARVLGVTATPTRLDGQGLDEVFDRLIIGPTMRTLVDQGYLVPTEVYAPPVVARLDNLRTVAGDYDKAQVAARMDRPVITGDAVEHYLRLARGKRAIAFCATLDHAAHVAERFSEAGVPSERIDGAMESEARDDLLRRFASGSVLVLASCQVVEEGFDCPEAEVAILLRPTASVRVFLQQVGRIMRPLSGKARGLVLDHVGNVQRCGLPDANREWTLKGRKTKGQRVAPMTRCPSCFACFATGPVACPYCGAELPQREVDPIEEVDGELEKVEGVKSIQNRMREQRREEAECESMEDFVALGVRRGYAKPRGWAFYRWNARLRRA